MGLFNEKKAFDRKWTAGDEEHDEALAEAGVVVEAPSRIGGQPTSWLMQDVVPEEAVAIVAGEPGTGKTFLACQLAADAAREAGRRVVLATSGSECPQLIRWRLDRAGGDPRRVALAELRPKGFGDRRANPSDELIDERLAILCATLEAAGATERGGDGGRERGSDGHGRETGPNGENGPNGETGRRCATRRRRCATATPRFRG